MVDDCELAAETGIFEVNDVAAKKFWGEGDFFERSPADSRFLDSAPVNPSNCLRQIFVH